MAVKKNNKREKKRKKNETRNLAIGIILLNLPR